MAIGKVSDNCPYIKDAIRKRGFDFIQCVESAFRRLDKPRKSADLTLVASSKPKYKQWRVER